MIAAGLLKTKFRTVGRNARWYDTHVGGSRGSQTTDVVVLRESLHAVKLAMKRKSNAVLTVTFLIM